MELSRISITNFRNFAALDVDVAGNVVVVGENRVGKSNLLHALRLLLDPALSDAARQLTFADFWEGVTVPAADVKIVVSVEIKNFEADNDVLALLTDFRLDDDPDTVRLTYEFRPSAGLADDPASEEDYEFICYGGEDEAKTFGHDLRKRVTMDVLPALRDVEGDLAVWRRSPLRPLIEKAFSAVDRAELDAVGTAVEEATEKLADFEEVRGLETSIAELFAAMSGSRQDVKPRLGFGPTDPSRLYRSIRLLIDEGARPLGDASLGSANLMFLSLKALELQQLLDDNRRDHTFLCIEEPEAHLHPHLQRSVYRHMFETLQNGPQGERPLSVVLTTHSPHIASVAPLDSIVLLKQVADRGSVGYSSKSAALNAAERDDIARYLDVTRAEILFARAVILVEGDAERFLVPVYASLMDVPLDHLGITVCSVAGTNFIPYAKFLTALGIPFSVITDWDPTTASSLGGPRARKLVMTINAAATQAARTQLARRLDAAQDDALRQVAAQHGVFLNEETLEVDLFRNGLEALVLETLRERRFNQARRDAMDEWEANTDTLDVELFLKMVDAIGKGRFAQRLVSRFDENTEPPEYIRNAIRFVADRV